MIQLGVDLLEIDRVSAAIARHGQRFFDRLYSPQELIDCEGSIPSLAARLAAKEAVAKALGTGIGDVGWKEIEIVRGLRGEPQLRLSGRARQRAEALGLERWSVSLSHTDRMAMAAVVAQGRREIEEGEENEPSGD